MRYIVRQMQHLYNVLLLILLFGAFKVSGKLSANRLIFFIIIHGICILEVNDNNKDKLFKEANVKKFQQLSAF